MMACSRGIFTRMYRQLALIEYVRCRVLKFCLVLPVYEADRKLPPVDQWNPEFCGDIDIRIARNGSWYHEGRPFLRPSLVRLLSSILKREGDDYFLVSPVEKMRIQVEDVPFIAVGMTQEEADGEQILYFVP
jgi:hypothetical protein